MSVTLHVDGARWRAALRRVVDERPGIVPVVKGNGYGFGRDVLCGEATRLGVRAIAIGTYVEAADAVAAFGRDVLVMEPFRAGVHSAHGAVADERLVHTVTSRDDLDALRALSPSARVVVEGLTSMNRFGTPVGQVADLAAAADAVGVTLHLPLGTGHTAEIESFIDAAPGVLRWWVSHTSAAEVAQLRRERPGLELLPRVGTDLWFADPGAYQVRAHVLDVRRVDKRARAGYRQRPVGGGHVVVVSGGTSHGVAMESPAAAGSLRGQAIAVAEGVLEAAHRVRSPFTIGGVMPRFVEPPHMQCSLLALPDGVAPPRVGDTVPVRMRLTTAYPDEVVIS